MCQHDRVCMCVRAFVCVCVCVCVLCVLGEGVKAVYKHLFITSVLNHDQLRETQVTDRI